MSRRGQPGGAIARGSLVGAAAVRAGTQLLTHRMRRPFLEKSERADAERQARIDAARTLYDVAARLRGTALKIAQILHWESALASDAASDTFYRACYQAPPMVSSLVVDIFAREFGRPPWKVFAHFHLEPFAAASLGQVHAARTDDRDLCVKVRYPGIATSIETDLRTLRVVANGLPQRRLLLRLLSEIQARLREECDYGLERTRTQWFCDTLALDGVEVPDTIPELCSDSLLTQRRLRGFHLRDWLATSPTQEARDRCAQRLDGIFTRSLYELHRVHADPNPGNYLFRDDGTVGLIDFGCVKELQPEFADSVSSIIRAHVAGDEQRAFEQTLAFGFFGDLENDEARDIDRALLQPFVRWLVKPLQVESFDFGAHVGFAAECGRRFLAVVKHSQSGAIYPDLLFVNRTLYGLYRVFETLGARVKLRNQWVSA